ncbi:GNAT family N-acetyltransferase [Georgenia sp. 311]|uniref:GNAT family N-acetyltransferase n=1 Tax=Georgenia wutianyii TaxID=2585135 RepID=A0ABX5VKX9_9MICO|nr:MULTISPECIES: bifunctional GNAT family N-acetyltransferase/nucleoside triphosphate pyrophosphohydrolase family protein [Georgenia]QDB79112.1 GNAT family N-acetyltransferase [Georgenia wutianyii]TNC17067.1 GNAT family N-acetyltransferase [Georgenia sp. 311]
MEPFTLHDGDLTLSVPTPEDVDRVTEVCQDPEVQRWTIVPSPYGRQDAVDFVDGFVAGGWARGDNFTWAMRRGGRLVGMVGVSRSAGSGEIGYWTAPEARGAGLTTRAVGLVLDAAFGPLGMERVEWRAHVGNWPSWRVVWRHGFRREGQVRGDGVHGAKRVDQWIGTLLRDDPREPATPWDGPDPVTGVVPADVTGRDPDALVRQFHEHFGVPVARDAPSVDRERVHLRMALVAEELAELVTAVYGETAGEAVAAGFTRAVAADDGARDTVAAADALADLVYVLYGMAQECGIPLPAVLAEVHAANLSKLGPDGAALLREDGKVLKGEAYRAPDVAAVLARAQR